MNQIKSGAIFISDAHYSLERRELLLLLKCVVSKKIKTEQIFFMGDIFDLLIPPVSYTVDNNLELIRLIQQLCKSYEVYYFEGNHDFLISDIFPDAKCFALQSQPAKFSIDSKQALLMHGDVFGGFWYKIYCLIIRNSTFLEILKVALFDFLTPKFIKFVISKLNKKSICREMAGFEAFTKTRIAKLESMIKPDYIIDGHFHQGRILKFDKTIYVNVDSFACNKSFFQVEFTNSEIKFSKRELGEFNV